jgi:hypothetical protein
MSTIKSSADHIVINADGASKDIKFQANGVEKASISSAGAFTSTTIDATVLTGDLPVISGANLTGLSSGLSEVDQWRLTTTFQGDASPIASNWERNDTNGFGKIGTGMSQASGVFTFPSTGYWQIMFHAMYESNNGTDQSCGLKIEHSSNSGASWTTAARQVATIVSQGGWGGAGNSGVQIIDVTSTSTIKVRFTVETANAATYVLGATADNFTYTTFIKLGDT